MCPSVSPMSVHAERPVDKWVAENPMARLICRDRLTIDRKTVGFS